MTDILIRGMEMPSGCMYCYFYSVLYGACKLTKTEYPDWFNVAVRATDCPLVELPPHGDLIEAEPIKKFITDGLNNKEFGYDAIQVLTEIECAPVIVPAGKEETE